MVAHFMLSRGVHPAPTPLPQLSSALEFCPDLIAFESDWTATMCTKALVNEQKLSLLRRDIHELDAEIREKEGMLEAEGVSRWTQPEAGLVPLQWQCSSS